MDLPIRHRHDDVEDDDRRWNGKLMAWLADAQPFDRPARTAMGGSGDGGGVSGTTDPSFPIATVPDTATAARLLIRAADRALAEWSASDGRLDFWTHPAVYRRVFADWVGPVYDDDRGATWDASEAAEAASARGSPHTHPRPSWLLPRARRGAKPGATAMYRHAEPERFGHATVLVPRHEASPLAHLHERDLTRATLSAAVAAAANRDFDPTAAWVPPQVVRLRDIGWYLGGFLGSVLVWTQLALVEAPLVRTSAQNQALASGCGFSVRRLIRHPERVLDPPLLVAWKHLAVCLAKADCADRVPVPDLVRVPQEWCRAMDASHRGEAGTDYIRWRGLSGTERREESQRAKPPDLSVPAWVTPLAPDDWLWDGHVETLRRGWQPLPTQPASASEPPSQEELRTMPAAERWRLLTQCLRRLEAIHTHVLTTALLDRRLGARPLDLSERYLPMPEPPHPMPALLWPWTELESTSSSSSSPSPPPLPQAGSRWHETVLRPACIRRLWIQWLAIPCLETGLAIEEWGRCWSAEQRAARDAEAALTPAEAGDLVRSAIRAGQSVLHWESPYLRRLDLAAVVVLDELGPLGDGQRLYDDFDRTATTTTPAIMWPRSDQERRAAAWFCCDRMTTTERMRVEGPPRDEFDRWEDSGIELPQTLIRQAPRRHRSLRHLALSPHDTPLDFTRHIQRTEAQRQADHASLGAYDEMWRQAVERSARRAWRPASIAPWPVSASMDGIDLSGLDATSLAAAPVVRRLHLSRVALPHPTWLRELLTVPPSATASGEDELSPASEQAWRRAVHDSGITHSLSLTARYTLAWLGTDTLSVAWPHTQAPAPGALNVPDVVSLSTPPRQHHTTFRAQLPRVLFPTGPGAFRPFPNLTMVSLHDSDLIDVPAGLLQLAIATMPRRPLPMANARRKRPPPRRLMLWDLSHNPIQTLSDQLLISLAYLFVLAGDLALWRGARMPNRSTFPHLYINLGACPVRERYIGSGSTPQQRNAPWRHHVAQALESCMERLLHSGGGDVIMPAVPLEGLSLLLRAYHSGGGGDADGNKDLIADHVAAALVRASSATFYSHMMSQHVAHRRHQHLWML